MTVTSGAPPTAPLVWGVLGASRFALKKSVPRMQAGALTCVRAIASRDAAKAAQAAEMLGIERAYASYEALLDDAEIQAVYIPLPNHLHATWTARAARAGKHVLCEKPIALNADEAEALVRVQQETGVAIAEAFMVRAHPQWLAVRSLIASGRIGRLRQMNCLFSYRNLDPTNIRNIRAVGGGGLLDIGCYAVNIARWLFEAEPRQVFAFADRDPAFGTDRLTTAILEFDAGHASFSCATQLSPHEHVQLLGTHGSIEIQTPFKSPPGQDSRIAIDDGSDIHGAGIEILELPFADQFALQADAFARAVHAARSPENHIGDARLGVRVLDALFRSIESGRAERP